MPATKQDFTEIARMFRNQLLDCKLVGERALLRRVAQRLATHFRSTNQNFKEQQFMDACFPYGYEERTGIPNLPTTMEE